ncbi:MerR family transcriptional regulator [Roseateles puraquae]|uniref:MerR family transcriptional regulator n=1 Tax=Roseateles puraquae TaxID=431059 RepID=UPI0031E27608
MTGPETYAPSEGTDAAPPAGAIGIAAVERETGINKETLRVWERRYGFPTPWRDATGERLYPPEQVHKLRLVRRLMDAGHRPGRVVGAPVEELATLLQPAPNPLLNPGAPAEAPEIAACTDALKQHDIDGLRRLMSQAVLRRGLAGAVTEVFAPMTTRIGELWMAGDLQVFQEHIYSESLQLVLRQAIQALPAPAAGGPRVLLTTLPGETHVLGLLMAEALLTLEGAACLSLGAQTPLGQLVAAAEVHRSHVVALSFSIQLANRAVQDGLADLRAMLPPTVEIWAGGASRALRQTSAIEGVRCLNGLGDITAEVTRLRELLESGL